MEFDKKELYNTINKLSAMLVNKKMDEVSKLDLCNSLYAMLVNYYDIDKTINRENQQFVGRITINCLIPVVETAIKKCSDNITVKFYELYKKIFALAGRTSLEHFCDYMEWDKLEKVLLKRRTALKPFIFYLNKSEFDDNLKIIIASYPPSYGKTYVMNMYSAWCFGRDLSTSIIRLSYSDELVTGFSRQVKNTISDPLFADVFTNFKKFNGKCFDKEKESDWQIKNSSSEASHMARTRDGAVTGKRAKKAFIIDDITKGEIEATDEELHKRLRIRFYTDFSSRIDDPKKAKFIIGGTMWSPFDILNTLREDCTRKSKLNQSKYFKYAEESEDGSFVVIRVPALDDKDESTLPEVYDTKYYRNLRDNTDRYYFECVFQQRPIPLTGLEFAEENLTLYDNLPKNENGESSCTDYCFAVLDPARKGKDFVSMPICTRENEKYYLIDVLFQQKPMTELYDEIVNRIIQHKIVRFVIENNTDTSLKTLIEDRLSQRGYVTCNISEKYNTVKKEYRIKDQRGNIRKLIYFKSRDRYSKNSEYGVFMDNFTKYSFNYPNKHDDAPDSLALFASEIICDNSKICKLGAIDRKILGI